MTNNHSRDSLLKGFTFSYFMTTAVIVSYFPLYFDYKGYSKIQIGMLYSIGPMIGIVANLFWGILSDKFQTVKKILIAMMIGQLCTAFFAFQTDWFALLYLLMAAFFFFFQPVASLNDSQLMLSVSRSGKSFASYRVWGSIGFALSACCFGWLFSKTGSGWTPAVCLSLIVLSLLIAFRLKDVRGGHKKVELGGIVKIIGSRKFLWFLFLIMVMSMANRINDGFLALFLRKLGASDTIVGYSWTMAAISEIPVFFLLSKYGHRYKELALLTVAGFVFTLRFLLMSIVQDPIWVVFIQMMHSLSFGIFLFTAIRYISQVIPDEYRSSGQAIFAVVYSSLAGLASGTLGGWLFDVWGSGVLYLCAALMAFLSAIGFLATHLLQKDDVLLDRT